MSESQKWTILSAGISLLAILVSLGIWYFDRAPELSYVADSLRYSKGFTYITVANKPGTGTAIITDVFYCITDPDILREIDKIDPKSQSIRTCVANDVDKLHFSEGCWGRDGFYYFGNQVSCHIPPGMPNDFELGIVNPKWSSFPFVGTLIVVYNDGRDLRLGKVFIRGK